MWEDETRVPAAELRRLRLHGTEELRELKGTSGLLQEGGDPVLCGGQEAQLSLDHIIILQVFVVVFF